MKEFNLRLSSEDANQTIPADLLNNHSAKLIQIYCPSSDYFFSLDPQAFLSSNYTMETIKFYNCDISLLDFYFLSGFEQLSGVYFSGMSNVHLANWLSFPSLPNLVDFNMYFSTGLNEWTAFPNLARGLSALLLYSNEIQDAAMNRILNWAAKYSADTLQTLRLNDNNITKIPVQLQVASPFTKLQILSLQTQKTEIPLIPRGSFYAIPPFILAASSNGIANIKDGAFQGNILYKMKE